MIIGFLTFFSDARKSKFSLYTWSAGKHDTRLTPKRFRAKRINSLARQNRTAWAKNNQQHGLTEVYPALDSVPRRRVRCCLYPVRGRLRLARLSCHRHHDHYRVSYLLAVPSGLYSTSDRLGRAITRQRRAQRGRGGVLNGMEAGNGYM